MAKGVCKWPVLAQRSVIASVAEAIDSLSTYPLFESLKKMSRSTAPLAAGCALFRRKSPLLLKAKIPPKQCASDASIVLFK